ncbi:hypothetical protein GOP47_0018821 [Adiantum capillus-veneris]|uniref:Plastid lipid-associated protein/fibrillin conserved domain-containing protein n=1 Tax=Adiantum capillus-veneris TaxID=13818 RepID=A0A9D4UEF6_ADICA|nr:hypothetical protein GOP47_0018821 [Adiantum capillus-veneris]
MAAAIVPTKLSFQPNSTVQIFAAHQSPHRFSVSFNSPSLYFHPASGAATTRRKALPVLASIFPFAEKKDKQTVKQELLEAIAPLDRGVDASPDDQARVDMIAQGLEKLSPVEDTVTSPLINGKWELLYTTSETILKKQRPKLLRPGGPIYQAINNDTLRAQNLETWPFFNQVTANLSPLSGRKVAVKFDVFKIAGLISIKAPERARGELEITYLDEELRVSRGDKGNLFVLKMVDPTYRVPI